MADPPRAAARRGAGGAIMAAGPKAQYAHLANLAADFVRKRPNLSLIHI